MLHILSSFGQRAGETVWPGRGAAETLRGDGKIMLLETAAAFFRFGLARSRIGVARPCRTAALSCLAAALFCLAATPLCPGADPAHGEIRFPMTGGGPQMAVLPFANYSETVAAPQTIYPILYAELDRHPLQYIDHEDLRPILRANRIRSMGMIGADNARLIRADTGVAYLLLGSFDIYADLENPEVAISARLVRVADMIVVAAASAAATGQDYAGVFGIGRVTDIREVASRVARDLIHRLDASLKIAAHTHRVNGSPRAPQGNKPLRVAVVPFDNLSKSLYGGYVVSTILISELANAGLQVLEPGTVHRIFLNLHSVPRGGISRPLRDELARVLTPDAIVTGTVAEFNTAQGVVEEAAPELRFGARMLDASTGSIVLSRNMDVSGADSQLIFRFGRRHTLGGLVRAAMHKFVEAMHEAEAQLAAGGSPAP
ncbi:MAG: hypothetical protein GF355_11985 [Candidatus Eisenbacteria bacterium]|nr:hypothetical protein [Candidatus Eisenbacteria bacterium]